MGFAHLPDEELKDHKIFLNSPFGQSKEITVENYLLKELEIRENSLKEFEKELNDPNAFRNLDCKPIEKNELKLIEVPKIYTPEVRYFLVQFPIEDPSTKETYESEFLIPMYITPANIAQATIDISTLKSHHTFVKEIIGDEVNGYMNRVLLSFYDFVNLVSKLNAKPKDVDQLQNSVADKLSQILELPADDLSSLRKQFSL